MKELTGRLMRVQPNGYGIVQLDNYDKDGYFDIYLARYAGILIKPGNRLIGKARWTWTSLIRLHDVRPLVAEVEKNILQTVG